MNEFLQQSEHFNSKKKKKVFTWNHKVNFVILVHYRQSNSKHYLKIKKKQDVALAWTHLACTAYPTGTNMSLNCALAVWILKQKLYLYILYTTFILINVIHIIIHKHPW